jgi:hypothetical protein
MTHTLPRQNEERCPPRYLIYESLIRRYPTLVPRTEDRRFPSLYLFRRQHQVRSRRLRPLPDIRFPVIRIHGRLELGR